MGNSYGKLFAITPSGSEINIDTCLAIVRELQGYFTEQGIATMSRDLRAHLLYVAKASNQVVGFVTMQHKNNHVAEISWMAVKLDYQHRGIGSVLVDRVAGDLKSQGFRVLEVKTLAADVEYFPYEKTRRFYEKVGFVHLETIDPYPGWDEGNPCAIYVKVL